MSADRRHTDPFKDIVSFIRGEIHRAITKDISPVALATVISAPNPLSIQIDGMDFKLNYGDGFFAVSDHLNLNKGDRVVTIPMNQGNFYIVIAKFSTQSTVLRSFVGNNYENEQVGLEVYANEDRTDRYATLYAQMWSKIRGSVGGVLRVLTHLAHYHSTTVTGNTEVGGADNHTHAINITIDSATATNPE